MNPNMHPDSLSDVPWPTHDPRVRVADTSMPPGTVQAAPAAVVPPVRHLGDALRAAVLGRPLVSVAAAFACGFLAARVAR